MISIIICSWFQSISKELKDNIENTVGVVHEIICIVNRKDYFNMLKVTLISARKNTSLRLICLYDGKIGDPVYNLLKDFKVEIIIHELPYKKELMEIYSHEWMETELGKDIENSRIFGTFMRMEIPIIEKEDEYVLYTDMDIIFNDDILLKDLPHPAYLADI